MSASERRALEVAHLTCPATMAHRATNGAWKPARHLLTLDRAIVDTIQGGGGRILVCIPPRNGKSELCSKYLPAWHVGTYPEEPVLLASYEADFAAEWGRKARDFLKEHGLSLFGLRIREVQSAADNWGIEGHEGGMRTAGVGGALLGKGAKLFIIDDPHKNHAEAASPTIRQRVWDWFCSVVEYRLEPEATLIVVMARWHPEDLAGRILEERVGQLREPWKVLRLPAIAEPGDILGRPVGTPLWPERFPLERLQEMRRASPFWFDTQQQQRPSRREGGIFHWEWFENAYVDSPPSCTQLVRAWDCAATEGDGDYTVGVLMGLDDVGRLGVLDVVRGQWSTPTRNDIMRQTADRDGTSVPQLREQEPGSAGKDTVFEFSLLLPGHQTIGVRATGSKVARAEGFASKCGAGAVWLYRGPWNGQYLSELCQFPQGSHDDQVDASSSAYQWLAEKCVDQGPGMVGIPRASAGYQPGVVEPFGAIFTSGYPGRGNVGW